MQRSTLAKIIAGVVIALLVGIGGYAFTGSNTVPNTNVGAGTGSVSGYTISNIHYNLNATNPSNVDSVTFTVSPAIPGTSNGTVTVSAALSTGGPNTYTCTRNAAGDTVTCPTTSPQLPVDKLTGLTIVAAQ
jgi:hypothetical protein